VHVEHRRFDLVEADLAGRVQQRELLHFLVGRQQVALDAVGEERQRLLPAGAFRDTLALRRQPPGDPARQRAAFHGLHAHHDARAVERIEPGALELLAVQLGQLHDGENVVAQRLAVALQGV
jgi:hypothetical protein